MYETVRIYVGADRSQVLAVKVLEHSIKRHTKLDVVVHPMLDLPIKKPLDPRNWQRTGFSFSRFCIPELSNYSGKAIYLDADMLVFQDIAELWNIDFDGAKVVVQEEIPEQYKDTQNKLGAPAKRKKQCAVMLLDCARLDWKIENIIDELDKGEYDYETLMHELCILDEKKDIKSGVPFKWNSLEHYDNNTCLIHYTDMATQPWVSCKNQFGYLWLNELRLMLKNNSISMSEIQKEIDLGFFRPSLIRELKYGQMIPGFLQPFFQNSNQALDKKGDFKPHQEVYRLKKIRKKAMKDYKESQLIN